MTKSQPRFKYICQTHVSQALFQTLQTTRMNFENPARQTSFQKPQIQSFNLLQVCSSKPPFVLAVLFIPPFIVFWAVILLFHSIWCQFLLLDCGSLSRHSFFKQFRATSHTSSSLFYLRTYKFYISGTLKFRDSGNSSQGSIL